ncbi:hypothetical protein AKJ51_03220 [candidate division MSBL1 archaeon SCGC-AAA382A20]|uniref:DUF106 domain-containing protein n=1 Tax=candidate division MSBL1 archaeon SCGC-AAA382A20 TaxID=1698280 RepID=A0A133VJP2_9EURY|nr:hypothetical protein AKJ51_03220 [candidate division MSBL1 archaeon SCGC-AAA382A20]
MKYMMIFGNALYGVFTIAAGISILISLLFKLLMDQEEMQKVKDKMEELQDKSKEADDQEEAMKHQQEAMKHMSKQMKMQIKPMAVIFIIVIPLFWFVFPNLYPNAHVKLNETGTLNYKGLEKSVSLESQDPLKISIGDQTYGRKDFLKLNSYRFHVENYNEKKGSLKLERVAAKLPFSLPFVGNSLGWLGWYILGAIGLGQVFRKLLGAMP